MQTILKKKVLKIARKFPLEKKNFFFPESKKKKINKKKIKIKQG